MLMMSRASGSFFVKEKFLKEKLHQLAIATAEELGLLLLEFSFTEGEKSTLKTVIHRRGDNITTDDTSEFGRILSDKIDDLDLIEERYDVIVESPGSDRVLKNVDEYEIFSDREITFLTDDGGDYTGLIQEINDEKIILKTSKREVEILLSEIKKARLYFNLKKYL